MTFLAPPTPNGIAEMTALLRQMSLPRQLSQLTTLTSIVLLTGCSGSILHRYARLNGDTIDQDGYWWRVLVLLLRWRTLFGVARLGLEVQPSLWTAATRAQWLAVSAVTGIPLIATSDAHGTAALPYMTIADLGAHDPHRGWQRAVQHADRLAHQLMTSGPGEKDVRNV